MSQEGPGVERKDNAAFGGEARTPRARLRSRVRTKQGDPRPGHRGGRPACRGARMRGGRTSSWPRRGEAATASVENRLLGHTDFVADRIARRRRVAILDALQGNSAPLTAPVDGEQLVFRL